MTTRSVDTVRYVGVLATVCRSCGAVDVYVGARYVGHISLAGKYSLGAEVPAGARTLYISGQVGVDSKGNLTPELATSWDVSSDAKEVTYHLRPDAHFSDGTPVTAATVGA